MNFSVLSPQCPKMQEKQIPTAMCAGPTCQQPNGPFPPPQGMYAGPHCHPPHGPFALPQATDSVDVMQTRFMRFNMRENPEDCPGYGKKPLPGPPKLTPMPMLPPPQFAHGYMAAGQPPRAPFNCCPMPPPMAAYYPAGPPCSSPFPIQGYHFNCYH